MWPLLKVKSEGWTQLKKVFISSPIGLGMIGFGALTATLTVEIWDVVAGQGLGNNPAQPARPFTIDDGGDGDYFDGDPYPLKM